MATVKVVNSDTFNQWRIKTNEIGSQLGNVSGTVSNAATTTFAGQVGINATDFVGGAAAFTITNTAGTYGVAITTAGTGYANSDTILIKGSNLGGVDSTNDATITVTSVSGGAINGATVTGTAVPVLANELRKIQDFVEPTQTLTTTATTLADAINEHDAELGVITAAAMGTTASTVSTAILELETEIDVLNARVEPTQAFNSNFTSSTIMDGINELMVDLGDVTAANMKTTASTGVTAINELSLQIGGSSKKRMAADYSGTETDIVSALNTLYSTTQLGTLSSTFLKINGTNDMTGVLTLHSSGMEVIDGSDMIFKTYAGSTSTQRMEIKDETGNVGIGGAAGSDKVNVTGTLNATNLKYATDDTDARYLRITAGSGQTVANNTTFSGSVTFSDPVIIGSTTIANDTLTITEFLQDTFGAMVTGNTETGGITAVYNDTTGKITLDVANNSHSHTSGNISDLTEAVQDIAGAMVTGNTESGIGVSYDDGTGKLNFNVNDPTVTLTGAVTGSATMTNLGNISIATTHTADPTITLTGAVTGAATMTNLGSVSIVTTATADPTLTLTGDATGSATFTNLGNASLAVTVANNSHTHTASNITDLTESVQDTVGAMVSNNSESGISVTYDDSQGELNFDVSDPVITLTGAVTGTATMTNLGSVSIATSLGSSSGGSVLRIYNHANVLQKTIRGFAA